MNTSFLHHWCNSLRIDKRRKLVSRARRQRVRLYPELLEDRLALSLGPQMVLDINPGTGSSFAQSPLAIGSNGYFPADDGAHGTELWKTDGTAVGTQLVKDIIPGAASAVPAYLTNVNGTLFFTVDGNRLWKSDGSEAGTVLVSSIVGSNFTSVNGTLFFSYDDGFYGTELWKSDGTAEGTTEVADVFPGGIRGYGVTYYGKGYSFYTPNSSNPQQLTNVNGTLFFTADDVHGRELWKSDGTSDGTVLVADINPGGSPYDPAPASLTNVNGTLFFEDNDGAHGLELWRSDGTPGGTFPVSNLVPTWLTNVNGTLFFSANDGAHGEELWKSDGTAVGTVLVKDINPGSGSSGPSNPTDVNGTPFFEADDGTHGWELWKSDGTPGGTVQVKDINPGRFSSGPTNLINANGTLFFTADDGSGARTLWRSDGSAGGTISVASFANLAASPLTNVNGTLFFSADDGIHGQELWDFVNGPDMAESGFPANITAGVAGSFTVTAQNADGSTNMSYGGTVHFTSSDPQAVLPADYTFTAADKGVHTFGATLKSAGNQSITVADTVVRRLIASQGAIIVKAAAASSFTVAGFPSPAIAGAAGAFTVTAWDAYGNRASSYLGTVHFTSTDPLATVSAVGYDAALDFSATDNPNGVWSYGWSPTLTSPFQRYAQAGPNNENPPPANILDTWNAGTGGQHSYPSVLHNGTSNPITSNAFTYLPGQLGLHPGPNGEYSVVRWTAPRAGSVSLGAVFSGLDFGGPTSTDVHVRHNGAALFDGAVNAFGAGPSFDTTVVVAAGDTIDFAVGYGSNQNYHSDTTGLDAFISYGGSPMITNYTFTPADAGRHTFSATFGTVGVQSLTATDTATPSITGAEQNIEVTPVTSLKLSGFPATITAGAAGNITITAKYADGSTNSGYRGTVHFSSGDPQAVLPADYTFTAADGGVHTFSATLKTAGSQSITVSDTQAFGAAGTQSGITVNPAAASRFTVAGFPSPVTAGVAGGLTVTAWDPYGNRATGYRGTVHFKSSDAKAVLPGNYTFTAADGGVHTFGATLKTAGTQSLTATDTAKGALTGAQGSIQVNPAAASRFVLSAPASVKSGAKFSLTVTIVDAYGNVVTGYRGTISFRSSDSTASLPTNYMFTAADLGVHTFTGLILRKKGTQTITVTDTLDSSIAGSVSVGVSGSSQQ
jgi:ELWxxDGT repeat protein